MVRLILVLAGCTGVVETDPPPPPPPPECPTLGAPRAVGTVPSPPAVEISGIAISGPRIWVHNDGATATLHAIGRDGTLLGTVDLGVSGRDHEDLAAGPGPDGSTWLYLGDIGDNGRSREDVVVHSLPEPASPSGSITPTSTTYVYEDGPRDAETLFVDDDGDIWIVSKETDGLSGVYLAGSDGVLRRQATLAFGAPPLGQATLVTGGDFGPRGLVLRTYLEEAYVWPRDPSLAETVETVLSREPCPITLAPEAQAEAIAWGSDGIYTVSEGLDPALNFHPFESP